MKRFVSIIIPVRNEEAYIGKVIKSIYQQDYGSDNFEVILVDGESSDSTVSKINSFQNTYVNLKLLMNPHRVVPYALNIAINNAKGEIIVRLDAHSIYPSNYLSELVKYLYELNADNVGGVFDTQPANNTLKAFAISEAIKSPMSVGNSFHRTGKSDVSEVDTVPYGCFKREIFEKIGLFDTDMVRNQDDEFNSRIRKNGGRIYILPHLRIKYYARENIRKTANMFYQYGLFKPLVNKKNGSLSSLRQLAPPIFVLGIIIGVIISILNSLFAYLYIGTLLLYLVLLVGTTINISFKTKRYNPFLLILIPTIVLRIHWNYGIGYIVGQTNLNNMKYWHKKSGMNTSR